MYYDRTFTVMLDYISIFVNVSFLKKLAILGLFLFIFVFSTVKSVHVC